MFWHLNWLKTKFESLKFMGFQCACVLTYINTQTYTHWVCGKNMSNILNLSSVWYKWTLASGYGSFIYLMSPSSPDTVIAWISAHSEFAVETFLRLVNLYLLQRGFCIHFILCRNDVLEKKISTAMSRKFYLKQQHSNIT